MNYTNWYLAFFLSLFYCADVLCTREKILFAMPFVASNGILAVHSLCAVYKAYSSNQRMTTREKGTCGVLIAASVISVGYGVAIIVDNLN